MGKISKDVWIKMVRVPFKEKLVLGVANVLGTGTGMHV